MKLFWKIFSCRPRPKPQRRGPRGKNAKNPGFLSRKWRRFFFVFFCLVFFVVLRPFCLSGAPFLIYAFFSGHALSPKVGGPYVFAQFSAKNTYSFTCFSSGAPCFVSCSFVFALLSLFCLSGAPFLILLRPFCLSGAPFLLYTCFFFRPRPKPQRRGPLCFCANFCQKHWFFCIFFLGGPLFCFLFFCFCSFKAFLSLGGPFSYISDFFRPRPEPQSRGPLMFLHNFLPKTMLFYIFSSGAPCFVSCSFVFALLSLFCLSGAPFLILLRPVCLSGAPFLVYTFFSGHALSPKVGGPYVFAQFSAKNTYSFTFFPRGLLVLFLVLLFLLF